MLNEKKVDLVPKLRQEVKVKVDIVTSDDTKIYHFGKLQDFTDRYIIKDFIKRVLENVKRAFGEFNNIFQDEFNKRLLQHSKNVRFFLSHN